MNDSGTIVGDFKVRQLLFGDPEGSEFHALLYDGNGPIRDVGNLGQYGNITAINKSGVFVGVDMLEHGVISNGGGALQELGPLGDLDHSSAYDINDSGKVVGYAGRQLGTGPRAFISDQGNSMRQLSALGGVTSCAYAINNNGLILGGFAFDLQNGGERIFLCGGSGDGPFQELQMPSDFYEHVACAMNNSGQFVMEYNDTHYNYRSILYRDGTITDVTAIVDPAYGFTLINANDINDAGQIVGSGRDAAGQWHPILLTPIPEPSALALLATGAATLLLAPWRMRRVRR